MTPLAGVKRCVETEKRAGKHRFPALFVTVVDFLVDRLSCGKERGLWYQGVWGDILVDFW